jgi:hypothetical protein
MILMRLAVLTATCVLGATASAVPVNGTGNVKPDVIFGSGNTNGSFTGSTANDVELGLRGKLRYNLAGQPENTFNYDGDRTYTFLPGASNAPANRSAFNFEWSINVDPDGSAPTSQNHLGDLDYLLQIDFDPSAGTDFEEFDPIQTSFADHSIGTNATANGQGQEATTAAEYLTLISNNNVAQQSWNLGFFQPTGFDPQTQGIYTINLIALYENVIQNSTSIDIVYGAAPAAVPEPSSLALLFTAIAGIGLARRRRNS